MILCVLAPIAGGLYWVFKHKEHPVRAKKALITSCIPVGMFVLMFAVIAIAPADTRTASSTSHSNSNQISQTQSSPSANSPAASQSTVTTTVPRYTIEDEYSWSYGGNNFVEIRVIIHRDSAPSDQEIVNVANDIYLSDRTWYDMVKVFVYAPGDDLEWVAYATLEFRDGALVSAGATGGPEAW